MAIGKSRATLATCSGAHVLHDGLTDVLYVLLPVWCARLRRALRATARMAW